MVDDLMVNEARNILSIMRALASRGPDSAINVQLLGKINELENVLTRPHSAGGSRK